MAAIAIGGAIGASLRYIVSIYMFHWLGNRFPYGIMTVNIVGAFLMGILIGFLARHQLGGQYQGGAALVHSFLAVGLLGGLTTFSSFALDSYNLFERGDIAFGFLYITGSVLLAIIGLFAGILIMRHLG